MKNTRAGRCPALRAATLAVLLFGCESSSRVEIVNHTNEMVRSLTAAAPGLQLEAKDLEAGRSRTWRYRPERDGCFRVRAELVSGAIIEAACVGYTTLNETIGHRIVLNRDGGVVYEVLD
jgi:hypothetical protein